MIPLCFDLMIDVTGESVATQERENPMNYTAVTHLGYTAACKLLCDIVERKQFYYAIEEVRLLMHGHRNNYKYSCCIIYG